MNVGTKVIPVNYHGEQVEKWGYGLKYGYIRDLFTEHGEQRAIVYWVGLKKLGSWPVDLLKAV